MIFNFKSFTSGQQPTLNEQLLTNNVSYYLCRMLSISHRGKLMPQSPIRKLVPFAEAAKEKGITVYHLNIGQPDIETPKPVLDAVRNSHFKVLEYSHSAGNESYRKKLVEYYARVGIYLTIDEILVTTGASEAILFGFLSCFDPEDEVIIPEPFYANYHAFAVSTGIKVVAVTSGIETGYALPSMEEIEKKITSRTKAILICNPNNPTGYVYTENEMLQLRELILKHDLYLFSDEAYREFCYEAKHFSAMYLKDVDDNVILIDSISKRYSACGGRIGAFITKNKTLHDIIMKFAQARLSPPEFGQLAGEAAVDLPEDYFNTTKAEYKKRRNLIVKRLNDMNGVECVNPGGAFYVMAKLPIDDCDDFCKWLLKDFNYNGQTVMLAPATGFYETKILGKQEVRLAYVLNCDAINAAMDCLARALEEYPGKV